MTTPPVDGKGQSKNEGKVQYSLMPTDALREVARVLTIGAQKYEKRNWERGMPWSWRYDSLRRHTEDWWAGVDKDPENGTWTMACVAVNALFLLAYQLRGLKQFDDRERLGDRDARALEEANRCRKAVEAVGRAADVMRASGEGLTQSQTEQIIKAIREAA